MRVKCEFCFIFLARKCLNLALSQEKEIKSVLCKSLVSFLDMSLLYLCYSSMNLVINRLPWCLVETYFCKAPILKL